MTTVEMTGAELVHYMYCDLFKVLGWLDIYQQLEKKRNECKPGEEWKIEAFEDRVREELSGEVLENIIADIASDISRYEQNRNEFEKRLADMEVD